MKIGFICPSLQPGATGVGDYASLLAHELVKQGHQSHLISLVDAVDDERRESLGDASPLASMRLAGIHSWAQRTKKASRFLQDFQPDWVSIQFSIYEWHRRGLVWNITNAIRSLLPTASRIEVMFHETWKGEQSSASVKERAIGVLQRYFVLRFLRIIKPAVVHTHTDVYARILRRHGAMATLLPLFGTIQTLPENAKWRNSAGELLREKGVVLEASTSKKSLIVGIFGAILPLYWHPQEVISVLEQAALVEGRRLVIIALGRSGAPPAYWQMLARQFPAVTFVEAGPLAAPMVSAILHILDLGLSSSPWEIVQKSSAAAVLLEHGVPVIVSRDDWHWRHAVLGRSDYYEPLLHLMDATLTTKLRQGLQKRPPRSRLPVVAQRFIEDLQGKSTPLQS